MTRHLALDIPDTTADQIVPMLRLRDVLTRTTLSESTVRRMIAAGEFPQPDKRIGRGARQVSLWRPESIAAWETGEPAEGRRGRA